MLVANAARLRREPMGEMPCSRTKRRSERGLWTIFARRSADVEVVVGFDGRGGSDDVVPMTSCLNA